MDLPFRWDEPNWEAETLVLYRRDAETVLQQRSTGEFRDGQHCAAQECLDFCSLV